MTVSQYFIFSRHFQRNPILFQAELYISDNVVCKLCKNPNIMFLSSWPLEQSQPMVMLPVVKLPLKNKMQKTCFSPCLNLSCSVFNNLCLASWVFLTLERFQGMKKPTQQPRSSQNTNLERTDILRREMA